MYNPKLRIMKKLFDWDVEEKNVQICGGGKIPNKKAIVRTDNGVVMNVVNSTYEPLLNSEVQSVAEAIIGDQKIEDAEVFEMNAGRRTLVQMKLPTPLYVGRDTVEEYLTLINSHDGSTSFLLGFGNKVLSCQNQFYSFRKSSQFRIAHTSTLMRTIESTLSQIESVNAQRLRLNEYFEQFNEKDVSKELVKEFVASVSGVDLRIDAERLKEEFKIGTARVNKACSLENVTHSEMNQKGSNLWGLFNGATYYTNHVLKAEDVTKNLVFGSANMINEKAFNFCVDQL